MRAIQSLALLAALVASALPARAQAAPAAGLVPVDLNGTTYLVHPGPRAGIKPIVPAAAPGAPAKAGVALHSSARHGAVSPRPAVYLVFWGRQWSRDPAGAASALQAFFRGLFGPRDAWGLVLSQYCQNAPEGTTRCPPSADFIVHPNASPLAGVWFDNAADAPSRASQSQIAAEAVAAAQRFGNTTQAPNRNAQYVIASASGTHPDGFPGTGFCAYHGFTRSVFGKLAYTNLPYVPDLGRGACTTISNPTLLDGYFSTESHEYAEVLTDFWPVRGWLAADGEEVADICVQLDGRETLTTGTFNVQGIWSNSAGRCVVR